MFVDLAQNTYPDLFLSFLFFAFVRRCHGVFTLSHPSMVFRTRTGTASVQASFRPIFHSHPAITILGGS
jgi:hypothetical protein